ncbi:uncharacterized protein Dwil_GK18701 [Drosophila willistoni]|uniref:Mitochondrial import inner membrane translocase subunit TIM50 n=1 Tax=Drosophila willistoni TaxID=7260 RepID=B4N7L7_DROWI|nr:mitochondrial import inner membrane translocase subunit TIM50-A [Drosophila willistoni]EDW80356.1 uncharacterized protein Dwil_GK18701 [Drosophila willistoni]
MVNCGTWMKVLQHKNRRGRETWSIKRIGIFRNWWRSYRNTKKTSKAVSGSASKPNGEPRASSQPPDASRPSPESPAKKILGRNFRRKRQIFGSILLGTLSSCILWAVYELGKPELDQRSQPIEDELSELPYPQQYLQRMWRSLHYYQKMLEEPLPTKLLPNELEPPYIQPRYSLVLEINDVLVHPDWTYQTGWRFKKRPGVDYFLQQCSKHYEICVYTSEQGTTAFPILDALDQFGFIRYRLVRDATQLVDGQHIKNLNRLNRNLSRVILVDWDRKASPLHPDNTFVMSRWLGNDDDVQLFDLVAFLQLIAEHKVDDVREVLHYYRQFDDPIEKFKENQRKLLEQKQEKSDAEVETKSKSLSRHWTRSFMGSCTN